ncbi:MAG: hypothetical protein ABFD96_11315 [Armatimonadia bacterium]
MDGMHNVIDLEERRAERLRRQREEAERREREEAERQRMNLLLEEFRF